MTDTDPIEIKLAAARTRLILDKPFLGALVLRLPLKAADPAWCPTTATDARAFHYNPQYIAGLSLGQTQFMLAHEALHCALSHFARRGHRVRHRWDLACDFAINPLLVDDGLPPPSEAQVFDEYRGMTAEEIYPLLEDCENMQPLDQHLYDSGEGSDSSQFPPETQQSRSESQPQDRPDSGQSQSGPTEDNSTTEPEPSDSSPDQNAGTDAPPPLTPRERDTLDVQWRQRLAGAAQQATQAGKMSGTLAHLIDHLLQPQLPWRLLLARYVTATARDDFSYMRPSRRQGEAIQPSLRSAQVELIVAVDTSGSIRDAELDEFLAEISALKGQVRARVTLLPCDADLADGAPFEFEPWEDCSLPTSIGGGGGTDFRPVFKFADRRDRNPDLLVYFTDAEGRFPEQAPNYPVIWLVKGKENVPWGERIQLN